MFKKSPKQGKSKQKSPNKKAEKVKNDENDQKEVVPEVKLDKELQKTCEKDNTNRFSL